MPRNTVQAFRALGFDAIDARNLGPGTAPDKALFAFAQTAGRVVVTRDQEFHELANRAQTHPGIVHVRTRSIRSPAILNERRRAIAGLAESGQDYNDRIVVIEPGRTRVRRER